MMDEGGRLRDEGELIEDRNRLAQPPSSPVSTMQVGALRRARGGALRQAQGKQGPRKTHYRRPLKTAFVHESPRMGMSVVR